jgi:Na+/H+-dicarboxylate symporter
MKRIGLSGWILIAMIAGIGSGLLIHTRMSNASAENFANGISLVTEIFLRLIKMIIAPLVFSTLVAGIAKLGDIRAVGRIGAKTLIWFICMSLISLLLGMVLMNSWKLGQGLNLPIPNNSEKVPVDAGGISFRNFTEHVVPDSIIGAMASNQILQIVVFSVFFGIALAAIGEKGKRLVHVLETIADTVLKMTGYVMKLAPLAAFAAIAGILALKGPEVLLTYGTFIVGYYAGVLLLWILLLLVSALFIGNKSWQIIRCVKDTILLAFSTSSSEAAFPSLLAELESFGCPNRIVSFLLPLGYSFNLVGSMLYMTFAALFIAQAYGMHMGLSSQISLLLVLMFTSKGIAGVPRAAIVVMAGTLNMFHIPQQGLLLLLGIDQVLDMARSATNVVGNSLAAVVITKMEKAFNN